MTARRWEIIACVFLVVATFAVYGEVITHQFIHLDDRYYVPENPAVNGGLSLAGFTWAFTTLYAGHWMPLTWISHMLDCQVFGLNPGGHHLTNLLFHLLNTLLLFLWWQRTTQSLGPAFLVAALFALHPLHVESVAWVAARKDVLSTFFWLLTMWAYFWYAERPGCGRYCLVLLCFSLGLMAKPMLVTLPLVLLLLDYWPLNRRAPGVAKANLREGARGHRPLPSPSDSLPQPHICLLLLEKAPLLVLSALSSVVTIYAQKEAGALVGLEELPLADRVANALAAYVWYPLKMLWPSRLAVLYPHPLDATPFWLALGAGLALALATGLILWRTPRQPYLPVGWLWYLGTLAPVIGLVQAGDQAWADRFTYVPLIGLFIIAAWGARDLTAGRPGARVLRPLGAAVVLAALLLCTFFQVRVWRDSITLFTHTLRVTGDNPVIHNNLGVALAAQGKMEEAAAHFVKAMRLNPYNAWAQNRLGEDLAAQGRIAEAMAKFRRAVKLKPDFGEAYKNLGLALATQGKKPEAIAMLEKAVQINPDHPEAQNILQILKAQD